MRYFSDSYSGPSRRPDMARANCSRARGVTSLVLTEVDTFAEDQPARDAGGGYRRGMRCAGLSIAGVGRLAVLLGMRPDGVGRVIGTVEAECLDRGDCVPLGT